MPNPETHTDTPKIQALRGGIGLIVENQQDTATRGLDCMDLVKKHSEDSHT